MTVASVTNRKTFAGDDVTTSFGTSPVVFFDTSDLVVYVTDDATGDATTLVENTDYTATGGDGSTGTLDLSGGSSPWGALLADTTLVIVRVLPLTQETDFVNNDIDDAEVQEDALDKLTMLMQQNSVALGRVVRQPDSDPVDIGELPNVIDRAGMFLTFDSVGDPTVATGTGVDTALRTDLAASGGSALVGFIRSESGAVARTSQAKMRDFVSVFDFNAAGDGSTDDAAELTLAEAVGKMIWMPKTTSGYLIASAVATDDAAWFIDPTLSWDQFSDGGNLDIKRGFHTNKLDGSNIWRLADRVFVGEAAAGTAGTFTPGGGGSSWIGYESVAYTSGGTYEVVAGDTVVGATSGATAKVVSLTLTSGTWAGGDAAGVLTLNFRTGTFQAENLNVGVNNNVATIGAAPTEALPSYLARSAQLLVGPTNPGTSNGGVTGITAIGKTSVLTEGAFLGFGSAVVNDRSSGQAWGYIAETQHESGASVTYGMEISAKNKGTDLTDDPYDRNNGVFGLWLAAGGSTLFGGAAANPSNSAIRIVNHSGQPGWNAGIVFESTALTGSDGTTTNEGIAIAMARGHRVRWYYAGSLEGASIESRVDAAGSLTRMVFEDKGTRLLNDDGVRYFQAGYVDNSVNYPSFVGSATGTNIAFAAAGDDTDISINITPKGAGNINAGGQVLTPATSTAAASLRAPHGTAPTSPVNGDIWTTTAGLFVRINGSTVGPLS